VVEVDVEIDFVPTVKGGIIFSEYIGILSILQFVVAAFGIMSLHIHGICRHVL